MSDTTNTIKIVMEGIVPKQGTQAIHFKDMLPTDWPRDGQCYWVTGYRTFLPKEVTFPEIRQQMLEGNILLVVLCGYELNPINFIESPMKADYQIDPAIHTEARVLFITPCQEDDGNTNFVKTDIEVIRGLLLTFERKNIVFEHMFDNIYKNTGQQVDLLPIPIRETLFNFNTFPPPNISLARLEKFATTYQKVESAQEIGKEQLKLALRWFDAAIHTPSTGDAFLTFWIAIEALGAYCARDLMLKGRLQTQAPRDEIKKALKEAYGLAEEDPFGIKHISVIRNKTVHLGYTQSMTFSFLDFIEGIFSDVLFKHLDLPCENRAAKEIDKAILGMSIYEAQLQKKYYPNLLKLTDIRELVEAVKLLRESLIKLKQSLNQKGVETTHPYALNPDNPRYLRIKPTIKHV